ncbi:MAG: DUF4827 domain-containing protein [Prevotella sp.]|nr:DUF4827 domain-containing protein [Prevotella sp.]
MKKSILAAFALLAVCLLASCNDYETYADKKDKEREAIAKFIRDSSIVVISESTFAANGNTTDVSKNEYVYLDRSGVYLQIVRKGCGSLMPENNTINLLCRFSERNILTDSMLVRNDVRTYMSNGSQTFDTSLYVDKMSVSRVGSTFTASFVSGMMVTYHGSASVPAGWLVPLLYVNVGRPQQEGDEIAKVRIIVPHSQGTADASSYVYPCFYELTYEKEY